MLPSKKVLSTFILVMAMVVAIIIAFGREKSSTAINFASNLVMGDKISIPANPNWQAELGNVAVNLDQTKQEDNESIEETATDIVSRSLISNYLALKQNGTLNNESAQKLIDQTLALTNQLGGQVVLETKLNIIPDNGVQTITDYGNNLGNILKNSRQQRMKNELDIISQAIATREPSKIKELDDIIVVYENIATDLTLMPVPQTFVKAHLDIINGIKGMVISLKEMKTIFDDPIRSLTSIQLYGDGITIFTQALKATVVFIVQNKIIYKQGSGGYYLLYGI